MMTEPELLAKAFVQQEEGFQIDWSRQRLRFHALGALAGQQSLSDCAQKAWAEALPQIRAAVRSVQQRRLLQQGFPAQQAAHWAAQAGARVERSSFARQSRLDSGGQLEIDLEAGLLAMVQGPDESLSSLAAAAEDGPGLLLRLSGTAEPRARYQLRDHRGQLLHSGTDQAAGAFQRQLNGRWYRDISPEERRSACGAELLELAAQQRADGDVQLREPLQPAERGLLRQAWRQARVALSVSQQ